jgi:nucleoside-diphosphate-sugar epimerase
MVTGGAGFIGSHLCERLLAEGNDVRCVDNYYAGNRQNIERLLGNPRFEAMRHDITHPLFVEVDEIFNLACPASPIFRPLPTDDPRQRQPDITLARTIPKWNPTVALREGLDMTIKYFRAFAD